MNLLSFGKVVYICQLTFILFIEKYKEGYFIRSGVINKNIIFPFNKNNKPIKIKGGGISDFVKCKIFNEQKACKKIEGPVGKDEE